MVRILPALLCLLVLAGGFCPGTTLQSLTMDEMVQKSNLIVRGKATGETVVQKGSLLYTVYQVRVSERLKGTCPDVVQVFVPGGKSGRLRQSFAGTPRMAAGAEYVVFIWTGKSGTNHIIGLSQGLFDVKLNQAGEVVLSRGALDAKVLDAAGRETTAGPASITLRELQARVRRTEGMTR